MAEVSSLILKYAPWSYSKVTDALSCPLKFHKKYILKEKPVIPDEVETTIGTVVHKILEWTDQGMPVATAFNTAINTLDLTYEIELSIQTFRQAVVDWVDGLATFCQTQRVIKRYSEKKVALTQDFKLTGYWAADCMIRGNVDLMMFTGNGTGVVIDHKTGALKRIELHQDQLELYCLMADALVKGMRSVRAAIHFAGADPNTKGKRTQWLPEYSVEVVRTTLRKKWLDILNNAAEIADIPNPTPKEGWMCNYCEYRPICPLYS